MKYLLAILLFSAQLYGGDFTDQIVQIHYPAINKLELSGAEINIEVHYRDQRYVGESVSEAFVGFFSNDGKRKKMCVSFLKPFSSEVPMQLFVSCMHPHQKKQSPYIEINSDPSTVLLDQIQAGCNEKALPLLYRVEAPFKVPIGQYPCIVKYTLSDD